MSIISKAIDKKANRLFYVSTAPATEPVTVDELKLFARIDGTYEDTQLEYCITAARRAAENYLRRALIEQTITMTMDFWPDTMIELPRPPLLSVTSISTIDEDDTETTYSSDNYYVITVGNPGRIVIKDGVASPYNSDRKYGGYRIVYKAGYGDEATDVPQDIIEGIKLWATDIYENRFVRNDPPPEAVSYFLSYKFLEI